MLRFARKLKKSVPFSEGVGVLGFSKLEIDLAERLLNTVIGVLKTGEDLLEGMLEIVDGLLEIEKKELDRSTSVSKASLDMPFFLFGEDCQDNIRTSARPTLQDALAGKDACVYCFSRHSPLPTEHFSNAETAGEDFSVSPALSAGHLNTAEDARAAGFSLSSPVPNTAEALGRLATLILDFSRFGYAS
jgi:hypothetical protein